MSRHDRRQVRNSLLQRGVAQLVERLLWEQDAAGSNPVTPIKSKRIIVLYLKAMCKLIWLLHVG